MSEPFTNPPPPPPSARSPQSEAYVIPPQHPFFDYLDIATPRVRVVPTLIAANIIVYLAMGLSGVGWWMPNDDKILAWGVDYWPLTTNGQWWRLLTSAFVHFGLLHIAFNMWALYAVGYFTERLFGSVSFLLLYFACAILSGLTSVWPFHAADPPALTAGASGAIFAIFGGLLAFLVTQPKSFPAGAVPKLLRSTLGFIVLNVMIGFSFSGISNSAHLGGLFTGTIIGAVLARPLDPVRRKRQTLPRLLAAVVLIVVMIGSGIALIPKIGYDINADTAVLNLREPLRVADAAANGKFDAAQRLGRLGLLPATNIADVIEKNVLPIWSLKIDQLNKLRLSDAAPHQRLRNAMLAYCQAKHDADAMFVKAIRINDPSLPAQYGKMLKLVEFCKNDLNEQLKASEPQPSDTATTTDPAATEPASTEP